MNNRKYVIIESSEVPEIDFSTVEETSRETLRYSLDSLKVVLKYSGEPPLFLAEKTAYSHGEIVALLSSSMWSPSEPEG
jgi:hypothetical protein